jgi:hypothetical protein
VPYPPAAYHSHPVTDSDSQQVTRLTVSEIRKMHVILCRTARPPEHHLHWSRWRRRHQARARRCRYPATT